MGLCGFLFNEVSYTLARPGFHTRTPPQEGVAGLIAYSRSYLHGYVDMRIKAIQAVIKLSRDVSSSTAWQEINFWLSLKRVLECIEMQLRSVTIVMECL